MPVATVNIWYHVGSANEKPGRTGFAHLFEHLMFEGSKHVKEGQFDTLLESAGANNNASTSNDRTNYFIDVPVNALDLALFLDSDRMGFLLDAMPPEQVNSQRDVVKNERRQSYENRPYGMASLELDKMLWPTNHPYNWPVIGYMEDLTAATQTDVVEFFKKYYVPSNASLVDRRRHRLRQNPRHGRKVVQRRARRHSSRARQSAGGQPRHRQASDAHRSGRPCRVCISPGSPLRSMRLAMQRWTWCLRY